MGITVWENPPEQSWGPRACPVPQPTQDQPALLPHLPFRQNCEDWKGRLTLLGARSTPYPSAASHLLQTHVFKESLRPHIAPHQSAAALRCWLQVSFRGWRAPLQRRRRPSTRPSTRRCPATHLSQPPAAAAVSARQGGRSRRQRIREGGALRGRVPPARRFSARSGRGGGGGSSRWNELRCEQLLALKSAATAAWAGAGRLGWNLYPAGSDS